MPFALKVALILGLIGAQYAGITLLKPDALLAGSGLLLVTLAVSSFILLPRALVVLFGGAITALYVGLKILHRAKFAHTEMPITSLDLKLAMANPDGLIGAMQWPRDMAYAGLYLVLLALGVVTFLALRHAVRRDPSKLARGLGAFVVLGTAAYAAADDLASRVYQAAKAHPTLGEELWLPKGLASLAATLGAPSFVWMTSRLQDAAPVADFASGPTSASAEPTGEDVRLPIALNGRDLDRLPNVVMLLLESTIDINRTFDVDPKVQTSFSADPGSSLLSGELNVNAVGGGTWITEFETLTGLNSRSFGYLGYYTHTLLSPYVSETFVTYLKRKGYETLGFYSAPGEFYGTAAAYGNYGFDRFFDSDHFQLEDPWKRTDEQFIRSYVAEFPRSASRPFFAYAVTMENHAPHGCPEGQADVFEHRFSDRADFGLTCQLNVYVARQKSSERAVQSLQRHLAQIEFETGRPYVLMIFGDHQPHTFTGTGGYASSPFDYSRLRRAPKDQTFYQIRGSVGSPFEARKIDAPAYLLPTLLSAFVSRTSAELYLPENIFLLADCGPRGGNAHASTQANSVADVEKDCRKALAKVASVTQSKHLVSKK